MSDDVVEIENDEYPIIRVEDILYEENFYVWVYGKDKSKKLNDLGLRHYFERLKTQFYASFTISNHILF